MIPATRPAGAVRSEGAGRPVRRTVIVLGGVLLVLAVVAALVVMLSGRPAATYPAGSPEAAFQGYLAAWEARDLDAAYGWFSDRIRAEVTIDEFRRMDRQYGWSRSSDRRVVLTRSRGTGDRATLDLRIDEFSAGGLFGAGDTWSWATSVPLVREGGTWHVDEYLAGLEPMPLADW